jgi:hypothetical protein
LAELRFEIPEPLLATRRPWTARPDRFEAPNTLSELATVAPILAVLAMFMVVA